MITTVVPTTSKPFSSSAICAICTMLMDLIARIIRAIYSFFAPKIVLQPAISTPIHRAVALRKVPMVVRPVLDNHVGLTGHVVVKAVIPGHASVAFQGTLNCGQYNCRFYLRWVITRPQVNALMRFLETSYLQVFPVPLKRGPALRKVLVDNVLVDKALIEPSRPEKKSLLDIEVCSSLAKDHLFIQLLKNFQLLKESKTQTPFKGSLFELLENTYGSELTARVVARHHLVTQENMKAIFCSLAAHVREKDLVMLFEAVKGRSGRELAFQYFTIEERDSLCLANHFRELDSKHIGLLLSAFRTLPCGVFKCPISEIFIDEKNRDWRLLRACAQLAEPLDPLALREILAKEIAYLDLEDGQIVFIDGRYCTVKAFPHELDGVVGGFLVPMNTTEEWTQVNPYPITILFRGTQTAPSARDSFESINRDLSFSVGRSAFEGRKNLIKEYIQEIIASLPTGTPIQINTDGHSLGAADAVRAGVYCVQMIASNILEHVIQVNVFAHNTPGPEAALNEQLRQAICVLEQSGLRDLKIIFTYISVEGDPVEYLAGQILPGARINSPILSVQVAKCRSTSIRGLQAHTARPYTEHKQIFVRQIYNNRSQHMPRLLEGNPILYALKAIIMFPILCLAWIYTLILELVNIFRRSALRKQIESK